MTKNCTIPDKIIPGYRHCRALIGEKPFDLPVYCDGGGRCRTADPAYRYHGLARGREEFSFWQYTISGGIALDLDGGTRIVAPGEAMLLSVPEDHCYYLTPQCGHWDSVYLVFCGYDCRRLVTDIRRSYGSCFPVAATAPTLHLARERLALLAQDRPVTPFDAAAFGFQFLITLAGELATARHAEPAFMEKIRLLVRSSPHINVEKMRRQSGYSKLYFERVFKRFAGVTPAAYLAEQRMNHALELLRHTVLPIREIAERCGFRDSAYFCRLFRRRFHLPPGRWRRVPDA